MNARDLLRMKWANTVPEKKSEFQLFKERFDKVLEEAKCTVLAPDAYFPDLCDLIFDCHTDEMLTYYLTAVKKYKCLHDKNIANWFKYYVIGFDLHKNSMKFQIITRFIQTLGLHPDVLRRDLDPKIKYFKWICFDERFSVYHTTEIYDKRKKMICEAAYINFKRNGKQIFPKPIQNMIFKNMYPHDERFKK